MRRDKIAVAACTVLLLVVFGYILMGQLGTNSAGLISVSVQSNGREELINCWQDDSGELYFFLPGYVRLSDVRIQLNTDTALSVGDVCLEDGMSCAAFEPGVRYELKWSNFGVQRSAGIRFLVSSGVGVVCIDTRSGSTEYIYASQDNEEAGEVRVYTPEGALGYSGSFASLSGRGNNTWLAYVKKPYNLKLSEDADLLGMGAAANWVLLANAADSTHLRNKLVYDFAAQLGLPYSPECRWVDLYLNGEYAGLYLLTERNEVHEQRVDIDPEAGILVSMEDEGRLISKGREYIVTDSGQPLRIHHRAFSINQVEDIFDSIENAILSEDGVDMITGLKWTDLIDAGSWVNKYLIDEIFVNGDGCYMSQFFYIEGIDGKCYAGPVWDYDHILGYLDTWQYGSPRVFYANRLEVMDGVTTRWFSSLYDNEEFHSMLIAAYQDEFLPSLYELVDDGITECAEFISDAAKMDYVRWGIDEDFNAEVEYIREYLADRIEFLNSAWLEGNEYSLIRADSGFGVAYGYFAAETGKSFDSLPVLADSEYLRFEGWYYEESGEPFDQTRPVNADISIYARWSDIGSNKVEQLMKLLPLGILGLMGFILLIIGIRRIRLDR